MKKLIYRSCSNFCQKDLQSDLLLNIGDGKNNYLESEKNFVETLNKHAPKNIKICGGFSKTLRKAIMKRSQLKNKANKMKDPKV